MGPTVAYHTFLRYYIGVTYMGAQMEQEWKKGSGEMLILSLLEDQPRHGYDISKLIESRSGGALRFHVTTLYPLLYRLEKRGLIQGRWVEKEGQRRRRYYRLTREGEKTLSEQRRNWQAFAQAIARVTGIEYA
jgi:transcriptional regulator